MVLSCHLVLLHAQEVNLQCSRIHIVCVIFQEAVETCCLHHIQIKCFAGQFHCFSDCVVDNTIFKTKYSVVMHIFKSGKHNIFFNSNLAFDERSDFMQ